jgi:uncharacterized protein YkwD
MCLLAGALVVPSIEAAASNGSTCWQASDSERAFVRKMNASRGRNDLGKLKLDPELSRAAQKHTTEMIDSTTLFHTGMDRLGRWVTKWTTLGENVGYGGDVAGLHKAFMKSPTHRSNILLARYNHVGVSTARDGDGKLWVTVVFESTTDPGTTLNMPRC